MASWSKTVAYVFLFIPQKFKKEKIINQAAGRRKASCCCLVCLIEQHLKGLGAKKGIINKGLRWVRCMFVGPKVYVCGEFLLLRCMFVGSQVYIYGA